MLQFLEESKVAPVSALTEKREKLNLPHEKEADEYRIYYNERQEQREETVDDEVQMVDVTVYDYVSALSDHEPTDEEWHQLLTEMGFSENVITIILES